MSILTVQCALGPSSESLHNSCSRGNPMTLRTRYLGVPNLAKTSIILRKLLSRRIYWLLLLIPYFVIVLIALAANLFSRNPIQSACPRSHPRGRLNSSGTCGKKILTISGSKSEFLIGSEYIYLIDAITAFYAPLPCITSGRVQFYL